MDTAPDLDQRHDPDRLDLTDFAPDGDAPDDAGRTAALADFTVEDDDFEVIEGHFMPESGPVIDGDRVGPKTPRIAPAKRRTYVVSATVTSTSPPYQLLPYQGNRVSVQLFLSGRGVRMATSVGELPIVGTVPAMYPDGGAIIKFGPEFQEPLVFDGPEIVADQTVRITAYVTVEVYSVD